MFEFICFQFYLCGVDWKVQIAIKIQDLTSNGEPFEIVFISSDKSPEELKTYMKVIIYNIFVTGSISQKVKLK